MFSTLQSRLTIELLLAGISTLEGANEFLNSYIKKFNAQFALPIDSIKSVFEMQPNLEKINLTLAVLSSRKIDNGSCIKYHNNYYLHVESNGYPVHYHKGTSGMVIKSLDKKPKKRYIPPMSHPWKHASFEKYMKKQPHRNEVA